MWLLNLLHHNAGPLNVYFLLPDTGKPNIKRYSPYSQKQNIIIISREHFSNYIRSNKVRTRILISLGDAGLSLDLYLKHNDVH